MADTNDKSSNGESRRKTPLKRSNGRLRREAPFKTSNGRSRREAPFAPRSDILFDRAMSSLRPLSSRVASEDLYDLFVDYFENGGLAIDAIKRRRRR